MTSTPPAEARPTVNPSPVDTRPAPASDGTASTSRAVVPDLAAGAVTLAGLAVATWWLLGLPASHPTLAGALFVVLVSLVLVFHEGEVPGPGLGAANRITFGRAVLAVPVLALTPFHAHFGTTGHWWIIAVSTAVMLLDGVDGRVARRTGTRSRFGARFDMELDATLILALSLLVWLEGRAGAWILLIGLLRYLFVAAGMVWPVLAAELPPSWRRKTICVVQGIALLVCLGPIVPGWLALSAGAGALLLLLASFGLDVRWLLSRPAPQRGLR